ncbi:MAG: hypothetical protein AAGA96_04125 [Verrucomicrobiota bacterium]
MAYTDVLVLGAGASTPYGFPTGEKLKEDIVSQFEEKGTRPSATGRVKFSAISQKLKDISNLPFEEQHCINFADAFHRSQRYSVDAFIEMRSDKFLDIGKYAIAHCLRERENENLLLSAGDWYQVFFNNILPSTRDEPENFTVITFNYDRSLQCYLKMALQAAMGDSYRDGIESNINFHCLHGSFHKDRELPEFGKAGEEHNVKLAATIKLPCEVVDNLNRNMVLRSARQCLEDAKRIFVLGFGFDETNASRLFGGINFGIKEIHASSVGLGRRTREYANRIFRRSDVDSIFGAESESISDILREHL